MQTFTNIPRFRTHLILNTFNLGCFIWIRLHLTLDNTDPSHVKLYPKD